MSLNEVNTLNTLSTLNTYITLNIYTCMMLYTLNRIKMKYMANHINWIRWSSSPTIGSAITLTTALINSANGSNPSFLHLLSQRYSQDIVELHRDKLCFNYLQVYSINWVWAPVTGLTKFWLWFSQIHMCNITNCHLNCQDKK